MIAAQAEHVPVREISPPPVPTLSFKFWRWLPNWHNHYLCPDCRKSCMTEGRLCTHLHREHPRWRTFVEAYEEMKRPKSVPRALLWRDPSFRARHAAAVSVAQTRRWLAWRRHRKGDP